MLMKCWDGIKKMLESEDIKKRFALGISGFKDPEKEIDWKINTINQGVHIEVIITLLRSFVKSYEDNYFDNFYTKLSN